jgi:DNA-binding winged helix-turn-helix (wHTH) protein/Tfp pilus assembly protein PilF
MGSGPVPTTPVRFGVFEADLSAGELRRNGVKVRLQDLPFRVLALMLSRPGEVITREEFRQALWPPDVFVDFEQGISSAVMRLRDALRDSADNPIFIETIERRGYRWIGPLHPPAPPPAAAPDPPLANVVIDAESLPQAAPPPANPVFRRGLIFALPLLVLLFAAWIFRAGNRSAAVDAKSVPPPKGHHSPANREAEDFYLKGRFYWNKRTPESLNQAVEAFTQALARDPNYADAYVGLADCYNLLREFAAMPSNEAFFKAFAAAKKAVELDPQSADAHASLAFISFWGMWDARDAEKEFRRAIELDPNNAKAHHWFATFLHGMGRDQDALAEIDVARKLDPHSSAILADKGELLRGAGRYDEAVQVLTQLEAAEPDFASPHLYLRFVYFDKGDYPRFIAELRQEANLTHSAAQLSEADAAAKGFAAGGEPGLQQALLSQRLKLYEQGKISPFYVAESEARLGNSPEAIKYLTICVQSHDGFSLNVMQDKSFRSLQGNSAFEQLVAVLGLPPIQ